MRSVRVKKREVQVRATNALTMAAPKGVLYHDWMIIEHDFLVQQSDLNLKSK